MFDKMLILLEITNLLIQELAGHPVILKVMQTVFMNLHMRVCEINHLNIFSSFLYRIQPEYKDAGE